MPEFIRQYTPENMDEFTCGYLSAAEWLLDDEIDPAKVRGWSDLSKALAREECAQFQRENAAELARYYEVTGRDERSAGYDFFLTRNGHGAGFWARDSVPADDPCLAVLTAEAHAYGEASVYISRGWLNWC